jgi:hypothetical protein
MQLTILRLHPCYMSALEYAQSHWPEVKKVKGMFVVFGALMLAAGFGANELINNKTEANSRDREAYLRDRLDMTKEVKGALATLPNEALKQKTTDLVAGIRELVASENQKQDAIRRRFEAKTKHLGSEYSDFDEPMMQEAWDEMTAASIASSQNTVRRYEERYRADAVLLRDELLVRLPEEITQREDILRGAKAYNYYHFATGSGIIEDIALDLEKLAKALPTHSDQYGLQSSSTPRSISHLIYFGASAIPLLPPMAFLLAAGLATYAGSL